MPATKRFLSVLVTGILLFFMAMFLSSPARYAKSVLGGVSLWAVNVLPAAFPFLFVTALLTGLKPFSAFTRRVSPLYGKLFRVSGAGGGAALLSALSGYPVGAKLVLELRESGKIGEESFRLACLATTSGPIFLVGTVGSLMYGDPAAGWILFFSHLAAVRLVCLLLRFRGKPAPFSRPAPPREDPALLFDSVWNSVVSVLCVGGFIALFACFSDMLSDLGLFRLFGDGVYTEGVFRGLLEMTSGCAVLSREHTPLSLACSCALVTFGGVCVLCQEAAYLTRAGVPILPFLAVKLLQAALSFAVCLGVCALLL